MTVNLSIKGVPEATAEALRARAERNHRSLQGELMAIVSEAAFMISPPPRPVISQDGTLGGTRVGWRSIDDIHAELVRRNPVPLTGVPLGVDIVRADRDERSR